ncbi:hypothetical protein DMB65_02115 [Flavobacterium cheongpyeongense]|uniref:Uncharacterized protein n=1 Tax=Flavobacterium cheongpyeongense TaxID=2212651 RepID=A0A2V4C9H2_9FLAO|nr:hypothetical protein [Flavobacterium cheongpyeongense]PXY42834.1 hypothetical protein DMB65_02115 [Flavobacterium cheongpyeongense]
MIKNHITFLFIIGILNFSFAQKNNEIAYIKAHDSINRKAILNIENSLLVNTNTLNVSKTLIIGPNFWETIIKNGLNSKLTGINVNFHIPIRRKIIVKQGRAFKNSEEHNDIWKFICLNNQSHKLRKPNKKELNYYWSIISYDIEEPIYVIEFDTSTYIIDLDANGCVFFIEKI